MIDFNGSEARALLLSLLLLLSVLLFLLLLLQEFLGWPQLVDAFFFCRIIPSSCSVTPACSASASSTSPIVQEFVMSPVQLGIPYSRPRYFAVMKQTHNPDKTTAAAFPLQVGQQCTTLSCDSWLGHQL